MKPENVLQASLPLFAHMHDGRPHMCASPEYQTCAHQMRCTECEMHVDAEQAEVIAHRPGVLTIEVRIPTPLMVADLRQSCNED